MNRILLADAEHLPLLDKSVDLVFTSPPYCDARTYGINAQRSCDDWIEWMLRCVKEMVRVSKGLVLVNCAGVTRKGCYWPACEGLLYRWWKDGGECWRPVYWHRYGIPGSGGKQWLRANTEYVLAFKDKGSLPWADSLVNGKPCKFRPGGQMSYRCQNGRKINGERAPKIYHEPAIANPGNVILIEEGDMVHVGGVGGGMMGSDLASQNEAPFPVKLAEWFVRSFCPLGGVVCDPFGGSGTTMQAAIQLNRQYVVSDIRPSQVSLMKLRLFELTNPPA